MTLENNLNFNLISYLEAQMSSPELSHGAKARTT
jgi:hypothetical protein